MTDATPPHGVVCENCSSPADATQVFCPTCGFPQNGAPEEKALFRRRINTKMALVADSEKETKKAKYIIFGFSGLYLVLALFHGFYADDFASMMAELFICLLFLVLGAWSSKNPFGAILTAFIVYLTFQLLGAVVEPATLFQGIILKIFIIGAFVKGIRSAMDARQYMRELEKMKAIPADER